MGAEPEDYSDGGIGGQNISVQIEDRSKRNTSYMTVKPGTHYSFYPLDCTQKKRPLRSEPLY